MAFWKPYAEDVTSSGYDSVSESNPRHSPRNAYDYAEDVPLDLSNARLQEPQFSNEPSYAPQLKVPGEYRPSNGFYAPVTDTSGQISLGSSSSGCSSISFNPMTTRPVMQPPPPFATEVPTLTPNSIVDVESLSDDPDFQEFERNAKQQMAEKNGGALLGNNPRMRRTVRSTNPEASDNAYRRQREKNNFAAKKSRDKRKLKEIHLSLQVSYLEKQVAALKAAINARCCVRCQQTCLC